MMKYTYAWILLTFFIISGDALATPASDALLAKYKSEGAVNFDAERGQKEWFKEVKLENAEIQSCTSCHTKDLSQSGKHKKTQKLIEPMFASVNPDRYMDEKKIEKWFKRNCNDTWGRECTAQEKGNFLKFLLSH